MIDWLALRSFWEAPFSARHVDRSVQCSMCNVRRSHLWVGYKRGLWVIPCVQLNFFTLHRDAAGICLITDEICPSLHSSAISIESRLQWASTEQSRMLFELLLRWILPKWMMQLKLQLISFLIDIFCLFYHWIQYCNWGKYRCVRVLWQ